MKNSCFVCLCIPPRDFLSVIENVAYVLGSETACRTCGILTLRKRQVQAFSVELISIMCNRKGAFEKQLQWVGKCLLSCGHGEISVTRISAFSRTWGIGLLFLPLRSHIWPLDEVSREFKNKYILQKVYIIKKKKIKWWPPKEALNRSVGSNLFWCKFTIKLKK